MHGGRERFGNEGNGLLGEEITREEVVWALRKLKVKATTGKDGITADKINGEVLVKLWWERTNYCRRTTAKALALLPLFHILLVACS